MPVPMILCRLKDDHSTTKLIGETAIMYFQEWEPVPDEEPEGSPAEIKSSKAQAKPVVAKSSKVASTAGKIEE